MPGSFFDTNILVYLASADAAKADRAEAIVADGGSISVQVLNELTNVARRKMLLSWPEIRAFVGAIRGLVSVHPLTVDTYESGVRLGEKYGFSTYDAMIAASALEAGCDTLWSEDLQHGLVVDGCLRIVDPFRDS